MSNPVHLIEVLLSDYASPKVRHLLHGLILLGALIVTVWMSADGDWKKAAVGLGVALYGAANKANTSITPLGVEEPDDGLSYEEAGGKEFPETKQPGLD